MRPVGGAARGNKRASPARQSSGFQQENQDDATLEQCPLCGTELSQTKYREIRAKLRAEQERKDAELAEAKLAATRKAEQEFKAQIEEQRRAVEAKVRRESEQVVKKATADAEQLAKKLKAAEAREVEIRKEAQAEIERQKQAVEKKAKAEAKQEAESQIKRIAADRDLKAKQLTEANEREAQARKQMLEQAEKERQKVLAEQRDALEKDKDSALLKQQAQFNRDRDSLLKTVSTLQHQVDKKTANELGDAGEIDVFDALRDTFQGDKIRRIQKGQPGADILHEVMYKGESCGFIVTDSKNRQGWQYAYVTKLRQDQAEAGAEHAILATTVFPAGKKQMCIESGVIVISPGQVIYIVQLLRQAMISAHLKGLSARERATKMGRLYALITSEAYAAKFAEATRLTRDVLQLDVQEKAEHDRTWQTRGKLVKRLQNALKDMDTDVAAIVEEGHRSPASSVPQQRNITIGVSS